MNLNELMKDDTCQILLAIIVGIVICYFIFGQKGCGNKDGFSVGGQACTRISGASLPTGDTAPTACYGLRDTQCGMGPTTNICNWDRDATPPATKCGQFIANFQDSVGRQGAQCRGRPDSLDAQDAQCCAGSQFANSRLPGYRACLHHTLDNTPMKDMFNQIIQFKTDCDSNQGAGGQTVTAGAGGQSLPVEEIREMNIIESIKNMIGKVALGPSNQSIIDDLNRDTSTASEATFNKLFRIGRQVDMEFIILINTQDAVSPLNRSSFSSIVEDINIKTADWRRTPTRAQGSIKLGNMFDPYARLSTEVKKEIFCSKNTLTTSNDGQEKYDLLLKMRSTDEDDLISNLSCSGQPGWDAGSDVGTDKMYDIIHQSGTDNTNLTWYKNILTQMPQDPAYTPGCLGPTCGTFVSDSTLLPRISEVFDPSSISTGIVSYNMNQMVIQDKSVDTDTFTPDKPDYIEFEIHRTITNPRGSGADAQVNRAGTLKNYKLLFMDGMSSNGTPYIERIDAFNKYNLYNAYYKNLFYVQYLILKIFLGTDKYLPQSRSFLTTDPGKRNNPRLSNHGDELRAYDPLPSWSGLSGENAATNSMCKESGRDYLVLGLLRTDGRNHGILTGSQFAPNIDNIDGNGTIISESEATGLKFDFTQQSAAEYLSQNSPDVVVAPVAPPVPPVAGGPGECNSLLASTEIAHTYDDGTILRGAGADILCKTRDNLADCNDVDRNLPYLNCEWTPYVADPSDDGTCNARTGAGMVSVCRGIDQSDGRLHNRADMCRLHPNCEWIPAVDPIAPPAPAPPPPAPAPPAPAPPAPAPPAPAPPAPAPQTRCDSVSYIFDTGQGCEWLDVNNGEYDHKNCSEFVARSIGADLGHICAPGGAHGGHGVCQNGPVCTAPLPIFSGKIGHDGL